MRIELTPREREIAERIVDGDDVEAVSERLNVGVWTVKQHVRMIRAKLGCASLRDIPAALAAHDATE